MQLFKQLWRISFAHRYYKEQVFRGVTLIPFESAQAKMNAYGLAMKRLGDTTIVFYKEEDAKPSLLKSLQRPLKFTFHVLCDDPYVLNYSDIDLEHIDQCFFLSNGFASSLHQDGLLTQRERIVQITSFESLDGYITGEDINVNVYPGLSNTGKPLYSGTHKGFKEKFSFEDLLNQGCFSVSINGAAVKSFYAVNQKQKKLFAILELTLDPAMLQSKDPFSYIATVGARQVTWRYNIVEKEKKVFSDFSLFAGKQPLTLKKITNVTLSNGSRAFVLEPSVPIRLSDGYDTSYEVEFSQADEKSGRLASRKRVSLPVPDISKIKVKRTDDGFNASSDMYVYL